MSTSVCWELTCDGLVYRPGESKSLICLTLWKLEISSGSSEPQCLGKDLGWKELTINKLKSWLGLYYMMGIVQKPSLHSYWEHNKVTQTPGFGAIMKRDHFKSILRFLHIVNKEDELPKDHPDHDRLFKLRPFIREIHCQFQHNYIQNREVSINETMVKFKGRKFFRPFLPSKPIPYGFKQFTLAESKSGYCVGLSRNRHKKLCFASWFCLRVRVIECFLTTFIQAQNYFLLWRAKKIMLVALFTTLGKACQRTSWTKKIEH